MTPPTTDMAAPIGNEFDDEAISRIRWLGWVALGAFAVPFLIWLSTRAVQTYVIEERQQQQYEQLREDIAEVKELLQK